MRKTFAILAALLVLSVVAQFFLAAVGAFDPAPNEESFQLHRAWGYAIVLLAVLVTIAGAVARVPGRLIGLVGLVAVLGVVQGLIAALAGALDDAGPLVFGLHAINALAILSTAGKAAREARALSRLEPAAATAQPTS